MILQILQLLPYQIWSGANNLTLKNMYTDSVEATVLSTDKVTGE